MTDRTWSSFATRSFGGAVAGVECVPDCFRPGVDRAIAYIMNGCIEVSETKPIKSLNYWMV